MSATATDVRPFYQCANYSVTIQCIFEMYAKWKKHSLYTDQSGWCYLVFLTERIFLFSSVNLALSDSVIQFFIRLFAPCISLKM